MFLTLFFPSLISVFSVLFILLYAFTDFSKVPQFLIYRQSDLLFESIFVQFRSSLLSCMLIINDNYFLLSRLNWKSTKNSLYAFLWQSRRVETSKPACANIKSLVNGSDHSNRQRMTLSDHEQPRTFNSPSTWRSSAKIICINTPIPTEVTCVQFPGTAVYTSVFNEEINSVVPSLLPRDSLSYSQYDTYGSYTIFLR